MKRKSFLSSAVLALLFGSAATQAGHPGPQPFPGPSVQTLSADGKTTYVETKPSLFPESDPFANPPGTNHLENVYENIRGLQGEEILNTLPSTPDIPYNLHDDPIVTDIDKTSPTDDMDAIYDELENGARTGQIDLAAVQRGIDILEGNPVPNRLYSGIPLLHYAGSTKLKRVEPILDDQGNVIGGNVDVHQVWYDSHIESDTSFINPIDVMNVPWTITYSIDVLNRGHDDFSTMIMLFGRKDDISPTKPFGSPTPHVGYDATFFPMEEGTRTTLKLRMPQAKYWNLSYHWGWRMHPPRVQVIENALKKVDGVSLPDWERQVFGNTPTASEADKLAAIAKISDFAPAKIMWSSLRKLQRIAENDALSLRAKKRRMRRALRKIRRAFDDWKDRTHLPHGVKEDRHADMTLFYANNTIYGHVRGMVGDNQAELPQWTLRGQKIRVKLINGDYFTHGYTSVDFGGQRGWENLFQSTVDVGGSGPWFTFGRFHYWFNAGAPAVPALLVTVPPAQKRVGRRDRFGKHTVEFTMNFEPSRRLRMYQFDPRHHEVAIWSVH